MPRLLPILFLFACEGAARDPAPTDAPDAGGSADAGPIAGAACVAAPDCGSGFDCYTLALGGYCMPGAPGGPTACRDPEQPCPTGTACSPLPYHAISGVCLLPCSTDADCRTGYRCDFVELFPGDVGTPRSAEKVCWGKPICTLGADQTCNDNPLISSLHGTCTAEGTCLCNGAYEKNAATGKCL